MKSGKSLIKGICSAVLLLSCLTVSAQNYHELSPQVKAKMDQNKKAGKNVYAGLVRTLELEVESCGSKEKATETLSVLSGLGYYKVEYVSPGRVVIHVNAENDYTRVRDFLFERKVVVKNYFAEKVILK